MSEVIYVDVLFILNFFVTYLLLLTTKYLLKRNSKVWRLLLGALAGAAYSLIILVPEMSFIFSFLGKFVSAAIIVAVSFRFSSIKAFFKGFLFFFASSFIYVGIMIAVWLTFKPNGLVINNASIYFNISPRLLIFSSLLAYIISTLIIKIHNRVTAKNALYQLEIFNHEKKIFVTAFVDTGNKLREPFSNAPVIVIDEEEAKPLLMAEGLRIIPYHTINGEGMLKAYPAEKVIIRSNGLEIPLFHQYIAISNHPFQGEYKALIHPELLNI